MFGLPDRRTKTHRGTFSQGSKYVPISAYLGEVQIVRYFKTSQSTTVIAPLNGYFKSVLQRHIQNPHYMCCTFICSFVRSKKKLTNQWTFHIEYVTKRTWHYVFRILLNSQDICSESAVCFKPCSTIFNSFENVYKNI